jgi:hypothetical protein
MAQGVVENEFGEVIVRDVRLLEEQVEQHVDLLLIAEFDELQRPQQRPSVAVAVVGFIGQNAGCTGGHRRRRQRAATDRRTGTARAHRTAVVDRIGKQIKIATGR